MLELKYDGDDEGDIKPISKYPVADRNRRAKMKFLMGLTDYYEKKRRNSLPTSPQSDKIKPRIDLSVPGTPVCSRYVSKLNFNNDFGCEEKTVPLSNEMIVSSILINKFINDMDILNKNDIEVTEQDLEKTVSISDDYGGTTSPIARKLSVDDYFSESDVKKSYRRDFSEAFQILGEPLSKPTRWKSTDGKDISIPGTPVSSRHIISFIGQNEESVPEENGFDLNEPLSEFVTAMNNLKNDVESPPMESQPPSLIFTEVSQDDDHVSKESENLEVCVTNNDEPKVTNVEEYFQDSMVRKTYQRTFSEVVQIVGKDANDKCFQPPEGRRIYSNSVSDAIDLSIPGTPVSSKNLYNSEIILTNPTPEHVDAVAVDEFKFNVSAKIHSNNPSGGIQIDKYFATSLFKKAMTSKENINDDIQDIQDGSKEEDEAFWKNFGGFNKSRLSRDSDSIA